MENSNLSQNQDELLKELERLKARVAQLELQLAQSQEEGGTHPSAPAPANSNESIAVTKPKSPEAALDQSEGWWLRALQIESVGVIIFRKDGAITWANDAFLAWSGYSRQEVVQGLVRWDIMTPPEYMPESLKAVEEFLTKGYTTPYEKEYIRKDGTRWWALFAATRISEEEGVEFITDITSQKQVAEALRQREETWRLITDNVPVQIGFYDRELRYQFVNAEYLRFFKVTREQIEGRSIREFVGETVWARLEPWMRRALAAERVTFEDMSPDKDGPGLHGWTEETYIPKFAPDGTVEGFYALVIDITERKRAEEALRLSEMRLRIATRVARIVSFEVDIASGLTVFDDNLPHLYRLEPAAADPPPHDWWELVQAWLRPADAERHRELFLATMRGEGDLHNELLVRNPKSGQEAWLETYGTLVRDEAGSPNRVVGIMLNISDRKRAEEALQQSEEKYRTLFKTMDEGFALCQLLRDSTGQASDYRVLEINPAYERHTGTTFAEIVGRLRSEFDPVRNERTLELCAQVVDSGEPVRFDYFNEGLQRWFNVGLFPRLGDQFVAVLMNITERKRAEIALRESEVRFRTVANLVPDLLWDSEPDGSTNWYNQRWLEYTGQTFEQAMGWGWTEAIHPEDRQESARRYQEAVSRGEPLRQEHRIRRYDGEYRWFVVNALPLKDEGGQVLRMYGAATDIHEQRLIREELERLVAERTADLEIANVSLGEERRGLKELSARLLEIQEAERRHLARELHDEIGQYLTGLKFLLETVAQESEPKQAPHLANTLAQLSELTERVRELSLNLRPTLLDDMGLVPALVSHIQRYRAQTGIEVEFFHQGLEKRLAPEVETVVYRVVQEALTNIARHAQTNRVLLQILADGQLTLLIQDEGRGFDPAEVLAGRASTGLSAMRERVELVGGEFSIETEPGYGTTLIAEIPLIKEGAELTRQDAGKTL